jgi:nucleoside-diphosphate-sugar epimerase
MTVDLFVLGAAGFLGREVVKAAVADGRTVRALVRSDAQEHELRALGAEPVRGDVNAPDGWREAARGARVLLDLVQPKLPTRLSLAAVRAIAAERAAGTERILAGLAALSPAERPLYLSVSGVDDLAPDAASRVHANSALRAGGVGFADIGRAVQGAIEKSGVEAAYVHLGTIVGNGKTFPEHVFPGLVAGKMPVIGNGKNRMALVHVEDAARALVHLAGLARAQVMAKRWIIVDGVAVTQRALFDRCSELLGVKKAMSLPKWLVGIIEGQAAVDTFANDLVGDITPLLASGFTFKHASAEAAMPDLVQQWRAAQR